MPGYDLDCWEIRGHISNRDTCHAIFGSITQHGVSYLFKTTWEHGSSLMRLDSDFLNRMYPKPAPTSDIRRFSYSDFVAYSFGLKLPIEKITDSGGRPTNFHHVAVYKPEVAEKLNIKEVAPKIQKSYIAAMIGYEYNIYEARSASMRTAKFEAKNFGEEDFADAVLYLLSMLKNYRESHPPQIKKRIEALLDLLPITHTTEFDGRLENVIKEMQNVAAV